MCYHFHLTDKETESQKCKLPVQELSGYINGKDESSNMSLTPGSSLSSKLAISMGMQAGAATLEKSMEVPQKTKNRTTL